MPFKVQQYVASSIQTTGQWFTDWVRRHDHPYVYVVTDEETGEIAAITGNHPYAEGRAKYFASAPAVIDELEAEITSLKDQFDEAARIASEKTEEAERLRRYADQLAAEIVAMSVPPDFVPEPAPPQPEEKKSRSKKAAADAPQGD